MPLTAAHSITPTTSGSAALSPTEITMALRTPPLARSTRTNDKDAPLREDIRLLGRLLGEVIRQQEGEAVFEPDLFAWVHIVKIMPDRRSAWCEIVPLEVWQN
jgi:hypothetical protein